MVMVFVCCMCVFVVLSGRRYLSYVDEYERDVDKLENNLKVWLLMKQTAPPRLAPYQKEELLLAIRKRSDGR
jgi:hypothetical protein